MTALLTHPLVSYGQLSLDLYGTDLALGMDRQTVLAKLQNHRVRCVGQGSQSVTDCSSLLIQGDSPPYDAYANVFFDGARVKSIRKYWSRGFEGSAPGKFVQTLYALLSGPAQQAGTSFRISVSERRDPGALQQTIFLTSDRRTISISYAEGLRNPDGTTIPPFVNLDEMIE
jgi:hypothetical protein